MELKQFEKAVYEMLLELGITDIVSSEIITSLMQAVFAHFTLLIARFVEMETIEDLNRKESSGEISINQKWERLNQIVLEEAEVDMENFRKSFWEKVADVVVQSGKIKELIQTKVKSEVDIEDLSGFVDDIISKYLPNNDEPS